MTIGGIHDARALYGALGGRPTPNQTTRDAFASNAARLAAEGLSVADIATALGLTVGAVADLLRTEGRANHGR